MIVINFYERLTAKISNLDIHFKELLKGAAISFILKVFAAGVAFAFNVILARNLGAEGAGVYFLALSIVLFFAAIGRLGMELVLVRQIAANVESGQHEKVLGIYQVSMKYTISFSLFLTLTLYYLAPQMSLVLFSKPDLERPLAIMSLAIVPIVLIVLHGHALQGLKKIASSTIVSSLIVPLLTSILVIVFVKTYGIDAVIWGYLFSSVFTVIIGRLLWIKYSKKFRACQPKFDSKAAFNCCKPLLGIVLMDAVVNMMPMFLLGVWGSSENIGIYGVASRTAMLTGFILMAVGSISSPIFAELYQNNKKKQLEEMAQNSSKLIIYLTVPILLAFVIFPEFILSIFGEGFKSGASVLIVLTVGQFVNTSTGLVGNMLTMTGHEKIMYRIQLFSMVLGLVLSLFLIPLYGMIGASISVALTISIHNIITARLVWMKLGIVVFPWLKS